MLRRALTASALSALLLAAPPAHALDYEDYPVVKLRTLDKITARTMTFEAKVGSTMKFGEIFIKVQTCRKPPPYQKAEASAFLQIWETDSVKDMSRWIFSGWMFSSSPTLSAMDHPVYDVWVIDCLGKDPEALPPPTEEGEGAIPEGAAQPELPPTEQLQQEGAVAPETPAADTPADTEESIPSSNLPTDAAPTEPAPMTAPETPAPEAPANETSAPTSPATAYPDAINAQPDAQQNQAPIAPAPEPTESNPSFEGIY